MKAFARMQACISAGRNDLPGRRANTDSDADHLTSAIKWLCRSQDATRCGGSAATYNLVLGWEDAYPETTGYIIPTLMTYAAERGNREVRDRSLRMADWLCTVQHPSGSFPGGTGEHGEPNVFNTGQIIFGLTEAFRETGDDRYRTAVRDACDWLVDQQSESGYWEEYDYRNQVHAYSTRIAWALLEGSTIVPERTDSYRDAAQRNLHWAVGLQRPNGWFENAGFESGETPYLHTIAYTVRGLLEGGLQLDDQVVIDAATRTADELLSWQQTNGILKGAYDSDWSPSWYYCLTGNSQMAIIWLRLFERTGESVYRRSARQTIEFLKRRQVREGPGEIRGGLAGSYPLIGRYLYLRFPNWGVKFFADALLLAQEHTSLAPTESGHSGRAKSE